MRNSGGRWGNHPALPRFTSPHWRRNWRGSREPMASKPWPTFSTSPGLKPITFPNLPAPSLKILQLQVFQPQFGRRRGMTGRSLRRVNADAAEEGAARMAVGDHAELLLLIAHGVPQVAIEMAVELVHLVAELGKSALQRDALAA